MGKFALIAVCGAFGLSLSACGGGGEAAGNEAAEVLPGQSVNAADGINTSGDASGTTGSATGDAGGPLNIAGDAEGDSKEADTTGSNAQ
jgi:hypothetical protein